MLFTDRHTDRHNRPHNLPLIVGSKYVSAVVRSARCHIDVNVTTAMVYWILIRAWIALLHNRFGASRAWNTSIAVKFDRNVQRPCSRHSNLRPCGPIILFYAQLKTKIRFDFRFGLRFDRPAFQPFAAAAADFSFVGPLFLKQIITSNVQRRHCEVIRRQ